MTYSDQRIVITGMGTVSAYGTDSEALWSAIREGADGRFATEDHGGYPLRTVRVDGYSPSELLGKRGLQFMPASALYLLGSSVLAMRDAGYEEAKPDKDRLGIVVGSNFGGFRMSEEYDRITLTEGPRYVSPMEAPNTLANSPASYLAIRIQSRAVNTTISTGACAGLDALGYAVTMLRKRNADVVVVGGTEEWNDQVLWQFRNSGILPRERFDRAGRPFDPDSAGVVPGEGSASAVLERYSDAKARGAVILGEIVSWHSAFALKADAESRARGLKRTMDRALQYGGVDSGDIGLVVSGANGMPESDKAEEQAIQALFAERDVPVRSVKGTTGEVSGAGGMMQLFAAVRSMRDRVIPAEASRAAGQEPQTAGSGAREWNESGSRGALLTSVDRFGGMSALIVREARD